MQDHIKVRSGNVGPSAGTELAPIELGNVDSVLQNAPITQVLAFIPMDARTVRR